MPDNPSWADTAATLLSKLSGGVELSLAFDQMELQMPNAQGPAATWKLNGSLRIRTKGESQPANAPAATLRIDLPAPSGRPQPTSQGSDSSQSLG